MSPRHDTLVQVSVPLAVLAAGASLAGAQGNPQIAAETSYLAFLASTVLLALAPLTARRPALLWGPALAVTALLWAAPREARGAAVALALVAALAMAAATRLRRPLELPTALGLALSLQLLFLSDRLLLPAIEPLPLLALLGPPLAAAVAGLYLARRTDPGAVLVGSACLLLAGPGWTVASTLPLVALAAGEALSDRRLATPLRALPLGVVLFGALLWEPRAGLLLSLVVVAHLTASSTWAALAVGAGAAVALAALPPSRPWDAAARLALLAPLLLPVRFTTRPGRRIVLAALLAVLAARTVPAGDALAAPLLLLAVAPRRPGGATIERPWIGLLLAGGALLAAYPWLRAEPAVAILGLLGLGPTWRSAVVLLALVAALAALARWRRRRPYPWIPRPGLAAGVALLALLALALPQRGWPVLSSPRRLDAGRSRLARELALPQSVAEIVVDSYLSFGNLVPAGRTVATVRLLTADGSVAEWPLVAGRDTGEWAVRRPDLARAGGLPTPPPWRVWVEPGRAFLGQRYRARHRLAAPLAGVGNLEVARAADLAPEVTLTLLQIELRP